MYSPRSNFAVPCTCTAGDMTCPHCALPPLGTDASWWRGLTTGSDSRGGVNRTDVSHQVQHTGKVASELCDSIPCGRMVGK